MPVQHLPAYAHEVKNWSVQAGLGALLVASVSVAACSDDTSGASSDGGMAAGGMAAGGNAAGGESAGGNAQGGSGATPTDSACGAPAVAPSSGQCALDNGVLPSAFACNPITNEGCNANEACDISGMTGFACYADNSASLCEACDQQAMNGPFCTEGTTCFSPNGPDGFGSLATCARYCCDDGDCGGGTCVKTSSGAAWFIQAPDVGVCLE